LRRSRATQPRQMTYSVEGLANGAHWPMAVAIMMGLPVVVLRLRLGGGAGLSDSETRPSSL
jgi:hypothetical protein